MTRLVKLLCLGVGSGVCLAILALAAGRLLADEFDGPALIAPLVEAPRAEESEPTPTVAPDPVVVAPAPDAVLPASPDDGAPPLEVPSIPVPTSETPDVPAANQPSPPPLVFRASDILRPNVLKGPNYEISEKVTLDKHRFVFEIQTPCGTLEARGMPMLEVRLAEMRAIDRARLIARDPQWIDGILHAIKMTPKGAYVAVTDPVGSVSRIPRGVVRLAMTTFVDADRRAGSDVRRRLAVELGCDPETSNPILCQLLNEMSLRKGIGSLAAQLGMNIALPGLALLPITGQFKETLANKLPHQINVDIDTELCEMGVKPDTRTTFIQSPNFTTAQRLVFLFYLRKLPGDNKPALVEGAADTHDESEALSAIHELKLLLDAGKSLRALHYEYLGLPVAVLNDGTNLIVTSADFIPASTDLEKLIADYRANYPDKPTVLYTSGRIAPDAQAVFHAARIQALQR